jgi:hypothetical protein
MLDAESMNEAAGHMLGVARIPVGTMREMPPEDDGELGGESEGIATGAEAAPPARPMSIADVARRLNNPRGTQI